MPTCHLLLFFFLNFYIKIKKTEAFSFGLSSILNLRNQNNHHNLRFD